MAKRKSKKSIARKPPKVKSVSAFWGAISVAAVKGVKRYVAIEKGKETQRRNQIIKEGGSRHAAEFWATGNQGVKNTLLDWRNYFLGPAYELHGRRLSDRQVLKDLIDDGDQRWQEYMKAADALGFESRAAKTAWFSPKARPHPSML